MANRTHVLAMVGSLLLTVLPAKGQYVLYVDCDALPGGDGVSWDTAFDDLQDCLDLAVYSFTIRVAEGTYRPDRGTGDRSMSFELRSTIALEGGYAGYGTPNPDERDTGLHETVLSGDLDEDDGPNFDNIDENSYCVVGAANTDASAVLDGFTVTGANDDTSENHAGLRISNASPTVRNCKFTTNWTNGHGAGLRVEDGSSPTILNSMFIQNSSTGIGAGLYSGNGCHPTVVSCIFIDNTASVGGGGLALSSSYYVPVVNCTFVGNSGDTGGGIYSNGGGAGVINCIFSGNTALQGGELILRGTVQT